MACSTFSRLQHGRQERPKARMRDRAALRGQGCIKLGSPRAGTGGREVFPLLSDGQSNPEGWQKVAGVSFQGYRGERPPVYGR